MKSAEFGGTLIGIAEPTIVTVDTGATRTRIALGAEGIETSLITVFNTDKQLDRHTEQVARTVALVTGGKRPDMVGYGIAGEVASNGLSIVKAGQLHAYGWTNQPIAALTADALNVELSRVLLINDLDTAGLAQREADRREFTGSLDMADRLPDDYAGVITAISTGTNSDLYSAVGALNTEAGHWKVSKHAKHPCGCGQSDDAEAWISGTAIRNRFGVSGKDMLYDDPRWDIYRQDLGEVMGAQLDQLRSMAAIRGQQLRKLSLFGSVAMGHSGAVEYLRDRLDIAVAPAAYGDDSGLYGGYFAGLERLQTAA